MQYTCSYSSTGWLTTMLAMFKVMVANLPYDLTEEKVCLSELLCS